MTLVHICLGHINLQPFAGGERSFTTVSFALAVGKHTCNPFRAMDEFDVFMVSCRHGVCPGFNLYNLRCFAEASWATPLPGKYETA